MSEVKDKFYEILVPKIEAIGFQFKKSKTSFVKVENGLEYLINFHWDGRGGTTMLDLVELEINDIDIQKELKKRTKRNGLPHVYTAFGYIGYQTNIVKIPVMYSKKTLDLANNMNFRALSQMPQDEKYPPERILNSANFVENLILTRVMPFFDSFQNKNDIFNHLSEQVKNSSEDISPLFTDLVAQYSETLGLPKPIRKDPSV
jgi:hypothetical protein